MRRTVKQGSARVAWLSLFLVCASAVGAQTFDVAKDVNSKDTVAAGEPAIGDGLQGNFLQRMRGF